IRRLVDGVKEWNIIGCEFNDINTSGVGIGANADARITLQNCVFQLGSGVYAAACTKGKLVVNDCRFKSARGLYTDGSEGNSMLELNRNIWDVSAQTQIGHAGSSTITIRGGDNQFYGSDSGGGEGFAIAGIRGIANLSGSMQCRSGIGT